MDHLAGTLSHLGHGFANALSPLTLAMSFLGCLLGTLVGVLPGIGPTSTVAILLPLTAILPPAPAIAMLAAISYGSQYGGSTTSILINVPGEIASVVTCLDGYQLTKQGRAGPALAMAAISSFVAGTLAVVGLTFFAPFLADVAVTVFGPAELFALMLFALTMVVSLSEGSLVKGLVSGFLGLLVAAVGVDPATGLPRFTFGFPRLTGGFEFISACIGLFALSELAISLEEKVEAVYAGRLKGWLCTLDDLHRSLGAILRSTAIGFGLGMLPGVTTGVASFVAYDVEKKVSKRPERFGNGAIEGVAAAEGANNAASGGQLVPLLALGIPSGPTVSILLGAFMMYGLQPGPMLFSQHPDLAWTIIASMYVGNAILLILNLPLVGLWARVAMMPYGILAPLVMVLSIVGAFAVRNSTFDVWVALAFGVVGYFFRKGGYALAPLLLGMVLGPRAEAELTQALSLSSGTPWIFLHRPVAAAVLVLSVLSLVQSLRRSRRRVHAEGLPASREVQD